MAGKVAGRLMALLRHIASDQQAPPEGIGNSTYAKAKALGLIEISAATRRYRLTEKGERYAQAQKSTRTSS